MSENHAKVLQALAKSSLTAETIFLGLALRERHKTKYMVISKFKRYIEDLGGHVDNKEFYKVFVELEKQGLGRVTKTFANHPSEFEWNNNIRLIGEAAISGQSLEQEVSKLLPKTPKDHPKLRLVEPRRAQDKVVALFNSAGSVSKVEIPAGADAKYLSALADFIRALHK